MIKIDSDKLNILRSHLNDSRNSNVEDIYTSNLSDESIINDKIVLHKDVNIIRSDHSIKPLLNNWLNDYINDKNKFESKLLFCSHKLKELYHITRNLEKPNSFCTWICCDLLIILLDGFADKYTKKVVKLIFKETLNAIYTNELSEMGLISFSIKSQKLHEHLQLIKAEYDNVHEYFDNINAIWSRVLLNWHRALGNTLKHWNRPLLVTMFLYWRRWTKIQRRRRGDDDINRESSFMKRIERYRRHYDVRTIANFYFSQWREISLRNRVIHMSRMHGKVSAEIAELSVENKRLRRLKFGVKDKADSTSQYLNGLTEREQKLNYHLTRCESVIHTVSSREDFSLTVAEALYHLYQIIVSWEVYRSQQIISRRFEDPSLFSNEILANTAQSDDIGSKYLFDWFTFQKGQNLQQADIISYVKQIANIDEDILNTTTEDPYLKLLNEVANNLPDVTNEIHEASFRSLDDEYRDSSVYQLATICPSIPSNFDDMNLLLSELKFRASNMEQLCSTYHDVKNQVLSLEETDHQIEKEWNNKTMINNAWIDIMKDADLEICHRMIARMHSSQGRTIQRKKVNQPFRAKPYTALSKKLRDLIVKLSDRHKITDMKAFNYELSMCERILGNNITQLKDLFQEWSDEFPIQLSNDGDILAKGHIMTQYRFWRLMRYLKLASNECSAFHIESLFSHQLKKSRKLPNNLRGLKFKNFLVILINIAFAKYPTTDTLSQRLNKFVDNYILRHSNNQMDVLKFHRDLCTPEAERQITNHEKYLMTIFHSYAMSARSVRATFDFAHLTVTDFHEFVNDLEFPNKQIFNHRIIREIFSSVQLDEDDSDAYGTHVKSFMSATTGSSGEDEMIFPEFIESVACLACYAFKSIYIPLPIKIDRFVREIMKASNKVEDHYREYITYHKRIE